MSDRLAAHGPGWTVDQPQNRPEADPALIETLRYEAPFDPHAAALLEELTTPEGHQ